MARQPKPTQPVAQPVAPVADAVTPSVKPATPRTCGAYVKAHEADPKFAEKVAGRLVTCHRLPMHKGDCRTTLKASIVAGVKVAKVAKPPKGAKRVRRVTKAQFDAALAEFVAGRMTPTAYMSVVTAYGQQKAKRAVRTPRETPAPREQVVTTADGGIVTVVAG
jgi:hypothetical protein